MRNAAHAEARKGKRPLLTPLVRALREAFASVARRRPVHPARAQHRAAKPSRPVRFEALEPRVLLSGDIGPAQMITDSISVPGEADQYEIGRAHV